MKTFKHYIIEKSCVKELEKELHNLSDHSYNSIDNLMQGIAKKYGITGKELHDHFKSKHGKTPDDWIKEDYVTEDGMGAGAVAAGPTNVVGSGAIAGSGGKGGEPGVNLRKRKRDPRLPMGIGKRKDF